MLSCSTQSISLSEELVTSLLPESWRTLAKEVREYAPDVVVLVARKTPRIAELLELDFGSVNIISDIAIPYVASMFHSARVAIVDDIVNVGSTLDSARRRALSAGAEDARLFALASCKEKMKVIQGVCYAEEGTWSEKYAQSFSSSVPKALLHTNKPYDIEFPIIPCTISPPFRTSQELLYQLKEAFGVTSVFDVTHPHAAKKGLHRWTVILPQSGVSNFKLRLYVDINRGLCNLVPFAIPGLGCQDEGELGELYPELKNLVDAFSASLDPLCDNVEAISGESAFRANLFLWSWRLGLEFLDSDLAEMMTVANDARISLSDVQLLFGPHLRQHFEDACIATPVSHRNRSPMTRSLAAPHSYQSLFDSYPNLITTPFFQDSLEKDMGSFDLFMSLFRSLAIAVGADDPTQHALDWPFGKELISENPYLRLRIGFTFRDLMSFCDQLAQRTGEYYLSSLRHMSAMLDWAIDQGGVVPVVTSYNGVLCRVYRKGERNIDDEAVVQANFAAASYGKPISRTRIAKIFAILGFSERMPETASPSAIVRGNVGVFPADSVLDDDNTDITRYFRDTGRLKKG